MERLIGLETEYGIEVGGLSANDWIAESIGVVRSHPGPVATGWNYRGEDPRRDMRGFTVQNLSMNPDDAQFDLPGSPSRSREEERSDRVLANGARLYNDHGHPEYASAECRSLRDLVAQDKAGERIVLEAARLRSAERQTQINIYKNNTDFHGSSYGCHENYLMLRSVPTDTLVSALLPFFASRPIVCGAGKVGVENDSASPAVFQISQRADFFSVEASVDTLHNRPIVNTRDEPHATPSKYRRLHVICGDANMSEYSTALKAGTTALVLSLLESGWKPGLRLKDPVRASRLYSRDVSVKQTAQAADGPDLSALDIQRAYHEACGRLLGRHPEWDWVHAEWGEVLDLLAKDVLSLADRLDWVAKYVLLDSFRAEEGLDWRSPYLQSLDLAYHDVDTESGLYYGLQQQGNMRRLVTDGHVRAAMSCPPADTRAYIRGLFVQKFAGSVRSVGWNGVAFDHEGETLLFDMNSLVESNVGILNDELSSVERLTEVVEVMNRRNAPATAN